MAWDRLQVGNVAALEIVARRLQLIEEAVSENPSAPSWEGARLYMGTDDGRGGAFMAPSLRAFVAGERRGRAPSSRSGARRERPPPAWAEERGAGEMARAPAGPA